MSEARWSIEQATTWRQDAGWLSGCNFSPSTAGNQLEMWQAETFDPQTLERELGWAADLGMNVVRVYLHDLLYGADGAAFLDRIDQVLDLAAGVGVSMMPVLFDGVWNTEPALGPQPDPVPQRHNSIWVQSPGAAVLFDQSRWSSLRPYVEAVLGRFGSDSRVAVWDLFNEPDQIDATTIKAGARDHKAEAATALVGQVFDWARDVSPDQPLTVGVWEYGPDDRPVDNAYNALALDRSDVISFHHYGSRESLEATIAALAEADRPLLCTEWLARSEGSTVEHLDVFSHHGVAAINWGLVDGRTQTRFPWSSWWESVPDDAPWFHELLHADGTPYDPREADAFRSARRLAAEPQS